MFSSCLFHKLFKPIELFFNSLGLFQNLGSCNFPLVALHTLWAVSHHLWCTVGGSVWIWMLSNLFQFIEGQIHFSTTWTKISWSWMNQYRLFFVQTFTLPPSTHQKFTRKGSCWMAINQLLTKSHVELEDYSICMNAFVVLCILKKTLLCFFLWFGLAFC